MLTVNGVTSYANDHYRLLGGVAEGFCVAVELSVAERDELLQLCRQRLNTFRARGRCECCGAGCCSANPSPAGPRGGPHRAQDDERLRRPQHNLQASDTLRRSDQNGKVAATSERRISRVSGSMGEGSKPMWR